MLFSRIGKIIQFMILFYNFSPKKKTDDISEETTTTKEYCDWCVEGYDANKYYEHTCFQHFSQLFEDIILPQNTKDLQCNLCDRRYSKPHKNDYELILHLAKDHKMLEKYLHMINTGDEANEKVHDVFSDMIKQNEIAPGVNMYYCRYGASIDYS